MYKNDPYPIERAAIKLLNQVRVSLKLVTTFFFVLPKRKDERMVQAFLIIVWLLFGYFVFFGRRWGV
jgi:hypothetical protein